MNLALAKDFIAAHPADAARVLERQLPQDSRGLIEVLEPESLAQLLPKLLPYYASQMFLGTSARDIARLVSDIEVSWIVAVLRCYSSERRDAILAQLSAAKRTACGLLLTFPSDSVGSVMIPEAITLPIDTDIESARQLIKLTEKEVESERLFVVDRNRSVQGWVSYVELNRARKKDNFRDLLVRDRESLPARMSIQTAVQQSAWSHVDVMPVTNRNQQFVGIIRHVDLRSGLEQLQRTPETQIGENPMAGIFEAYGNTLMTLVAAVEDFIIQSEQSDRK